jgi:hypothetical protein
MLCNPVIEGKKEVYDFSSNKKVTADHARQRVGIRNDSVTIQNQNNSDEKVLIQRDLEPEKNQIGRFY